MPSDLPLVFRHHVNTALPTTAYLRRRAATLHISEALFDACVTLGDLQAHAKQHYRLLAKQHHPDHKIRASRTGYQFRRVTAAYKYIIHLPATALVHRAIDTTSRWREYRQLVEPLGYVPPLPWAWGMRYV